MRTYLLIALALAYGMPFCLVLFFELASGPVTPALATLRAIVWPLYVTAGIPKGQRDSGDGGGE